MSESPLLSTALTAAAEGIPVVPLHTPTSMATCTCRRACYSIGKHPRLMHGLRDASIDPANLRRWWTWWPQANVGLVTGVVMDVGDVDSAEGLQALLELLGDDAATGPVVATGSGGWHLYFAATGLGNRVGVLPGLDWRGAGGYVVAPPSLHVSGRHYRWARGLDEAPLQPCPPAVRRLVKGPMPQPRQPWAGPIRDVAAYAHAALSGEVARVLAAPAPRVAGGRKVPGARNDTLNRAAFALGQLVGGGLLDRRQVERELTVAGRRAGLGPVEVARTIRSGLTAGERQPRVRIAPSGRSPVPAQRDSLIV
jgi:hypothetical protein